MSAANPGLLELLPKEAMLAYPTLKTSLGLTDKSLAKVGACLPRLVLPSGDQRWPNGCVSPLALRFAHIKATGAGSLALRLNLANQLVGNPDAEDRAAAARQAFINNIHGLVGDEGDIVVTDVARALAIGAQITRDWIRRGALPFSRTVSTPFFTQHYLSPQDVLGALAWAEPGMPDGQATPILEQLNVEVV